MSVGARYFQAVMDVMRNWLTGKMLSKMVNGQYAIEDSEHVERQLTGSPSAHVFFWQVRDAEQ